MKLAGIVEEQHPDRARLFMQWHQMDWPVMADPLNQLGVAVVPITLAIDEVGIVRLINPSREQFEEEFLEVSFHESQSFEKAELQLPSLERLEARAKEGGTEALQELATAQALWRKIGDPTSAIKNFETILEKQPQNAQVQFQTGAAYRMRYDSNDRESGDFTRAVEHWQRALELDPNQYIWRRRIQQYGPRLDKPYPFYDWIHQAREEIRNRGETPAELSVEPGGAEFAHPSRRFQSEEDEPNRPPDPEGRIWRDKEGLVQVEQVVVPAAVEPGKSARVHLVFRPNDKRKAHWNNEVGGLQFWVSEPEGWRVSDSLQEVINKESAASRETRRIEFEVQTPAKTAPGIHTLPGYALYYVCEEIDGACLYRRQDVPIEVRVRKTPGQD